MKKILQRLIIVVMIALLAAIAVVTIKDYNTFKAQKNGINEQTKRIAEIQAEHAQIEDRIQKVGEEMKALPDSMRAKRMGHAARQSWSIAKRQQQLDGAAERSIILIRSYERKQSRAVQHAMKWDVPLAVAFVLLGVILVFLKKTAR